MCLVWSLSVISDVRCPSFGGHDPKQLPCELTQMIQRKDENQICVLALCCSCQRGPDSLSTVRENG